MKRAANTRIHFFEFPNLKRILVGYIGAHLRISTIRLHEKSARISRDWPIKRECAQTVRVVNAELLQIEIKVFNGGAL